MRSHCCSLPTFVTGQPNIRFAHPALEAVPQGRLKCRTTGQNLKGIRIILKARLIGFPQRRSVLFAAAKPRIWSVVRFLSTQFP